MLSVRDKLTFGALQKVVQLSEPQTSSIFRGGFKESDIMHSNSDETLEETSKRKQLTAEEEADRFLLSTLDEVVRQIEDSFQSRGAGYPIISAGGTGERIPKQVHFSSPLVTEAYSQCGDDEQSQDTLLLCSDNEEEFELTPDDNSTADCLQRNATLVGINAVSQKRLFSDTDPDILFEMEENNEYLFKRKWNEFETSQVVPGITIHSIETKHPDKVIGTNSSNISNVVPYLEIDEAKPKLSENTSTCHERNADEAEKESENACLAPVLIENDGESEIEEVWHEKIKHLKFRENSGFSLASLKSQLTNETQYEEKVYSRIANDCCRQHPTIIPLLNDQTVPDSNMLVENLEPPSSRISNVVSDLKLKSYSIDSPPPLPVQQVETLVPKAAESGYDIDEDEAIPFASQNASPDEIFLKVDQRNEIPFLEHEVMTSNIGEEKPLLGKEADNNSDVSDHKNSQRTCLGKRKAGKVPQETVIKGRKTDIKESHCGMPGESQQCQQKAETQEKCVHQVSFLEECRKKADNVSPPAQLLFVSWPKQKKSPSVLQDKENFENSIGISETESSIPNDEIFSFQELEVPEISRNSNDSGSTLPPTSSVGCLAKEMLEIDAHLDKLIDEQLSSIHETEAADENQGSSFRCYTEGIATDNGYQQNSELRSNSSDEGSVESNSIEADSAEETISGAVCGEVYDRRKLADMPNVAAVEKRFCINDQVDLVIAEGATCTDSKSAAAMEKDSVSLQSKSNKETSNDTNMLPKEINGENNECLDFEDCNMASTEHTPDEEQRNAEEEAEEEEEKECVANSEGFDVTSVPGYPSTKDPKEDVESLRNKHESIFPPDQVTCNLIEDSNGIAKMNSRFKILTEIKVDEDQTLGNIEMERIMNDDKFYEEEKMHFPTDKKPSEQIVEEKEDAPVAKNELHQCRTAFLGTQLNNVCSCAFSWVERQKTQNLEQTNSSTPLQRNEASQSPRKAGCTLKLCGSPQPCTLRMGLSRRRQIKRLHPYLDKSRVSLYRDDRQIVPDISIEDDS